MRDETDGFIDNFGYEVYEGLFDAVSNYSRGGTTYGTNNIFIHDIEKHDVHGMNKSGSATIYKDGMEISILWEDGNGNGSQIRSYDVEYPPNLYPIF